MKRSGIIGIVILISTMLLMHSIIPHHHHEGEIPCFNIGHLNSGCTAGCAAENHDHASGSSEQELPSPDCHCLLDQFVAVSNDIQVLSVQSPCIQNFFTLDFWTVLQEYGFDFSPPEKDIRIKQPPYLIKFHAINAGHISGLRAPPVA